MRPPQDDALVERIIRFLREDLAVVANEITSSTNLVSTGVVDSVDLVRLVGFLESETGLSIPDADVSVDDFDSIADMLAYVARRRGQG